MSFSLAPAKNSPKPPRIIIHGDAGSEKPRSPCVRPAPVVIQTEDGLGNLDATAFPACGHCLTM